MLGSAAGALVGALFLLVAPAGATGTGPTTGHGPARADVPLEHSTRTTLPSDTVDVRIAMVENDTAKIVVTSPGGVVAPGADGADAVTFSPVAGGTWSVATGTSASCTGPWTPVQQPPVSTPVASPATVGDLLTLCADNGTRFAVQGAVEGVDNSAGQARTVNTLPLEEYVADVVPGESISDWGYVGGPGPQGRPWGFQELEAQAVAVRSYVLASPGGWGGYATTCDLDCQTYRGTTYLTANSEAAAVDTAGKVMVMPNGAIAPTEYSASTGGYTSSSMEGSPFTPVPDTGDAVCVTPTNPGLCNSNHDWSVTVPLAEIHTNWPKAGTTPTVTVSARNGYGTWGGRATQVTITGAGTSQTVPAITFATDLGLKSTYFTITSPAGKPLRVTGHGWGHGVGMGQWGAFGYAIGTDNGQGDWTWQRIVEHYYAPATLATLPDSASASFAYVRIAGATPDATAADELEHRFEASTGQCPGTATTRPVILATDASYPDALASSPLARSLGTGTLLTPPTGLSVPTRAALAEEGITRVVVVGGPLAVSTQVVTSLEATPVSACGGGVGSGQDLSVTRVFGQTASDTAAAIATAAARRAGVGTLDLRDAYALSDATGGTGRFNDTSGMSSPAPTVSGAVATAVLASGSGFQDAESASTLAYAERLPILLTTPTSLSSAAASAISTLGVRQVVLTGGPLAVTTAVVTALEKMNVSVLRVAGKDATDTSAQLALLESSPAPTGAGWAGTGDLTVAQGAYFSDGLCGAVDAADGPTSTAPEPLVLTESPTAIGPYLPTLLHEAGTTGLGGTPVTHLTVLGGPLAVTPTIVQQMGTDL